MRNNIRTDNGYLYLKKYNPYVKGVVGTDIKLTIRQKLKILFSRGISVCIGDVFVKESKDGN